MHIAWLVALMLALPAQAEASRWKVVAPHNARLERIAQCESEGNWRKVSPSRIYWGGLQFSLPAWRSVGGQGNPRDASKLEQKYRAVLLVRAIGYPAAFPNCYDA